MSENVVHLPQTGFVAATRWDAGRLNLIRRTVAKDCLDDEFSIFVEAAKALNLDPLRKQIYCEIRNKSGPSKRQVSFVTTLNGLRTIADRTRNYRPDEDEPEFVYAEAEKKPWNPLGLVKATVRVHKHAHGGWHKITGTAWWDEIAPVKDVLRIDETGKYSSTGEKVLDPTGGWVRMGRIMLAKCAESNALRRGWPDDVSNLYIEEEMDRARFADLTPAEIAAAGEADDRLARLGEKDAIIVDWLADGSSHLTPVPVTDFANQVVQYIDLHRDGPEQIVAWREKNAQALREFWGLNPADALDLKEQLEAASVIPVPTNREASDAAA